MWIEYSIAILLGLCFGSLNTLLAYRMPRGESIGMTRSRCTQCGNALTYAQLVPVLSWLWSKGVCGHCAVPIHWRYPATEIVTAALFAACLALHGFTLAALLLAILGAQIIVLCIIDYHHRIIPDALQLSMGATAILYGFVQHMHIADMLAGLIVGGTVGLALQRGYRWYKKQEGLGTGDVKFMCVAGLWLGVEPLLPFFFYAGVLGVVSALLWRIINRNDPYFPFGPALAISMFIIVLYPPSVDWHMQLTLLVMAPVMGLLL